MASPAADSEALDAERRLVQEAQGGNLDALRPLFEQYATPLYSTVILPRVGDAATAEDILRDTFYTAVAKIGLFEWQGRSFFLWLRQIAVHKAYDVHRRSRRQRALADALANEIPIETAPEHAADAMLIAEQERRGNRARIDAAMARLSDRYRAAITLRLIEERPREECAAELNVTLGTFDVLLYRAVRAFRKHFGARDEDADKP